MGNNLGISCAARLRKLLAQPSWFLKGDSNFLGSSSSLLIFEKSSVVSYAKKGCALVFARISSWFYVVKLRKQAS